MTDDIDALIQETPAETKAWFKQQVRTHGLRVAYEALAGVCVDPKAPAPAKATAAGFLFRAAGVLEKTEELDDKDPSTMTRAEMLEEYGRLTREADEAKRASQTTDIRRRRATTWRLKNSTCNPARPQIWSPPS